jgi:CBS domain-containing protein
MALCAKDVMRTKVRSIGPEVSLADLERALLEARRTGFPVVKDGRLIGVVSQSDIVRKLATEQIYADYLSEYYRDIGGFEDAEPGESLSQMASRVGASLGPVRVKDVMSRTPVTVSPDDPVRDVAKAMVERNIHRLPVISNGRLLGIITSLELVGLIADGRVEPT